MCGSISVLRSPIFSRFSWRSVTQKGRPEMSRTARARACSAKHEVLRDEKVEDIEEDTHLVERSVPGAVPLYPAHLAQSLLECCTECDRAILYKGSSL